jgi:hypothetical protein
VETVSLEKPAKPLKAGKPLRKPQPIQVKLPKYLDEEELAEQYVYGRLLEAGVQGILVEDLVEEATEEGYKPSTTRQAIRKLLETGKIREIGWTRIATKIPISEGGEDIYTIEVLKVEQGRVKILVNDEIEAILQPEDYNGPRNLIKKYAKFKAKTKLYTNLGTHYAKISEITEVLNLDKWIPGKP